MYSSILVLFPLLPTLLATPLRIRQDVIGLSTPGADTAAAVSSTDSAASVSASSTESSSDSASATASSTDSAAASATASSTDSASASATASSTDSASASASTADTSNDLTVVKFAALAENLENNFYNTALAKFDSQAFTDAGFADGQSISDQLSVINKDESTHLSTLQAVAKAMSADTADVDSCQFNFDSALTDVSTFLATARTLEFVGISAYLGGTTLIGDKSLLVNAAQITTVESRHNTVLNLFNSGSSVANAFDMALSPQQVLSIAAPFVSGGCDPVAALGLTPTPQLTVTNNGTVSPGDLVTFGGDGIKDADQSGLFCNMIVGGATEAINLAVGDCKVPDGLDGAVYMFLTNSSTPLSSNILNQDASTLVAGPALAFIDSVENKASKLLLSSSNNAAAASASSGKNMSLSTTSGKQVITITVEEDE
ncbi:hypothetical protein B9479_005211 [Cryptococcus floricola]|uniref:Protein rds1 n=1 Tax=Cryptococcus floricola TaxID=2591691 RepID=A0A5D3ARR8_9TREE|nr:hypothetical protein B9479_005211 [Cryptococcus floricola]